MNESETPKKPTVLWTKPLIEIIDNCIYIDDELVWRDGELVHRKDYTIE